MAGREEAGPNAAVGSWLEREAQDDEWYVDALETNPTTSELCSASWMY